MNDKILCTVVLYRMRLSESRSFLAAYGQAKECGTEVKFFIFDNSPESDPDIGNYPDVHYIYCPENKGLGYAYNRAAEYAEKRGFGWLLFLDQDTQLPADFLRTYVEAIRKVPDMQVFASRIRLPEGRELSPMRRWKKRRSLPVSEVYPLKKYLIINSGLCVSLPVFQRCGGYNERVWLDFADTQFIRRLWHCGVESFYLLPTACSQDFSNDERDPEKLKGRFRIYLECAAACERLDLSDWLFQQYCVWSHTLSLTLRLKRGCFIKLLFSSYLLR